MKIGFVWHVTYPWDVRLEKMLQACVADGHDVSLLCKGKDGLARSEQYEGVQTERVDAPSYFRTPFLKTASTFPLFFNPFWIAAVSRFIRRGAFDLVIVRDVPLAYLVGRVAKKSKIPVILDMAENYPAALKAYQNVLYKPLLFADAWLPRAYEKHSLKFMRHVLVVAEEQRQRLISAGVNPGHITLIGNTPVDSFVKASAALPPGSSAPTSESIELVYVGKLDIHRGTDLLIRALPELRAEFPSLHLTLVGDGKDRQRQEKLAHQLDLSEAVSFPGWVPWSGIAEYIRESTLCLIPHLRSEHTDTTLPNKLFDYMAFSKPTIASDCRPLRRILEEENCGATFRSGDVASLRDVIRQVLKNPRLSEMGKSGRRAIELKYNWANEKPLLLNTLSRVAFKERE